MIYLRFLRCINVQFTGLKILETKQFFPDN